MRIENYTARYVKTSSGFMGQIVEWPEVVTEGCDIEDCRNSLKDALKEMIEAYKDLRKEIPLGSSMFEPISAEIG